MKDAKQNRLKSPIFWTSLSTQVLGLLVLTGVIGNDWVAPIQGIVVAICQAATVFGLLNDPTTSNKF